MMEFKYEVSDAVITDHEKVIKAASITFFILSLMHTLDTQKNKGTLRTLVNNDLNKYGSTFNESDLDLAVQAKITLIKKMA